MLPSSSQEPSSRCVAQASSGVCGLNSPVIASNTSCCVTKPCTSPYSSMTNAMCTLDALNCSNNSIPVSVSGTNKGCTKSVLKSGVCPRKVLDRISLVEAMPNTFCKPPLHTGKRLCGESATTRKLSSKLAFTSKNAMSARGTISEVICLSSNLNTLRSICRSWSSITPASDPSSIKAWISSSISSGSSCGCMPNNFCNSPNKILVDAANNHTNGLVNFASRRIGLAIVRAIGSAFICPIRLGTSSPKTIDKYVMMTTTKAVAA